MKFSSCFNLLVLITAASSAPLFDEPSHGSNYHNHHQHKRNAIPDPDPVDYVTDLVLLTDMQPATTPTTNTYETLSVVLMNDVQNRENVPTTAATTTATPDAVTVETTDAVTDDVTVATPQDATTAPTTLLTSVTTPDTYPTLSLVSNDQLQNAVDNESNSDTDVTTPTSSTAIEDTTASSTQQETTSSDELAISSSDNVQKAAQTGSDSSVESYARQAKGIAYSPYTNSGSCKSSSEIETDMQLLSTFDIIRIYAPDCNVVEEMLKHLTSSQQIFAGLFYLDTLQSDINLLQTQVATSSRGWSAIHTVSIGNEWINGNVYDVQTVINALESGKSLLASAGWSGSVVTVDTAPAFQNNPSICDHISFVAVNQHPFFSGSVAPEDSGTFLVNTISELSSLCGKNVMITETGWPTQGDNYGSCVPGTSEQLSAIKSIVEANGVADVTLMFTTYDDYWKSPGPYGVEQHWGIFD